MSTIAKYFTSGKRKLLSSSSQSDTSLSQSPEQTNKEKRQKPDMAEEEEMSVQDMMYEMHTTMSKLSTKEDVQQLKDDIQRLRQDMEKLAASLTRRIDKLEGTVFDLANEKDQLKAEVGKLREEKAELQGQLVRQSQEAGEVRRAVNDQEQHGRQWNLRVFGVQEVRGEETVEDCVKACVDIFTKKLGVSVSATDVEIAHRSGRAPVAGGRPRPILVRFHSRRQRGLVLTARRKLKQSGISIGEDLTQANYRLLQKASQHSATLSAWSSNGKIIAKMKNGKTLRLELGTDIDTKLSREM